MYFTIKTITAIIIASNAINCHPVNTASNIVATNGIAPNHINTNAIKPSPPITPIALHITFIISSTIVPPFLIEPLLF